MPKGDYIPLRIEDGVEQFLEATRDRHNGRGYDDLVTFLEQGLNTSNIGRAFGLGWQPMKKIITQHKKELDKS